MPKEVSITLYSLPELKSLNNKAFETALQTLGELFTSDNYWYDFVFEEWKPALVNIGFEDPEIFFRLAYCQGDGACFTAKHINFEKMINFLTAKITPENVVDKDYYQFLAFKLGKTDNSPIGNENFNELLELTDYMNAKVVSDSGMYSHENSCHIEDEELFYRAETSVKTPEAIFSELIKCIEEIRYKLSKAIYDDLVAEYENVRSEEYIMESFEVENYQFTKDGELWK